METKIIDSLNWRYAVQLFDASKKISETDFKTILEAARLSPSAFGIEPWKFIVVENKETRMKLREAGYNQPKITDADKLVVLAYRTDAREKISNDRVRRVAKTQNVLEDTLAPMKKMIDGSISLKSDIELDTWVKAQAYIPLGIMIETAALLQIDTGPMEGFSQDKVDEILGLKEKHLRSTTMLALGYRGEDPAANRPKTRQEFSEVVEFVK